MRQSSTVVLVVKKAYLLYYIAIFNVISILSGHILGGLLDTTQVLSYNIVLVYLIFII